MGRLLVIIAISLAALACAGPAVADAVTYRGTLGERPIILEITTPLAGGDRPFGRFAFMAEGTDIPLNGVAAEAGTFRLAEERRCTRATCLTSEGDPVAAAPIGADWVLTRLGASLSGTRTDRHTGKTLPVRLERRAARPIDNVNHAPLEALMPENRVAEPSRPLMLDPAALPYDFLKLDWPREVGAEMKAGEVVLRTETDRRTGIGYPVVVTLGGPDTEPINAYLLQRRMQVALDAFSCRARAFLGFGWNSFHPGTSDDDVEGVEEDRADDGPDPPTVTLEHVSPRLIGLSEANSFWCGGAHPDNYVRHHLADARTGAPIVPETLLAGWKIADLADAGAAPTYAASGDLVEYVRSNRARFDESTEASCNIDELVADPFHFGVYVAQDDLVFTLRDLPFAIAACTHDLLKVPLAQARPLLTERAARLFPALDE